MPEDTENRVAGCKCSKCLVIEIPVGGVRGALDPIPMDVFANPCGTAVVDCINASGD